MKLRLQHNSVRLRLKRAEVAQLAESGRIEEKIVFASNPEQALTYVLETVDADLAPQAELRPNSVHVRISARAARHWAESEDVGIEEHQPLSPDHCLHVLIEKDFACLDRNDAQNEDTFPHPNADPA